MTRDFPTRPSKEVVREALNFIRDTGEPQKWPGHTHTRPDRGANVEYLAEFDLPKSRHKIKDHWAPCPICSPTIGKYFLSGKVAWFPDEGVVRMIGGDCYASLVGSEQHEAALAEMKRLQQIEYDEAFVASRVPFVRESFPKMERILAYCRAVDNFRGRLLPRMGSDLHSPLWQHVSTRGELRVTQAITEMRLVGNVPTERRTEQEVRYGGLEGHEILRPPPNSSLGDSLAAAIAEIESLVKGDTDLTTNASPEKRSKAIKRLTRSWGVIAETLDRAKALARFIDVANISTLRTWAARRDSPMSGYFAIKGGELLVGLDDREITRIPIPAPLLTEAPMLEPLSSGVD